jgi:hypothetical protein
MSRPARAWHEPAPRLRRWLRRHLSASAPSPHLTDVAGRLRAAPWRQYILARITELGARAQGVRESGDFPDARTKALLAGVERLLDAARDAAARTVPNVSESVAERAWDNVRAAEELLHELDPTGRAGAPWWHSRMSRSSPSPHLGNPAGRRKATSWRQAALARVTELDARAAAIRTTVGSPSAQALLDGAQQNLDAARDAAAGTRSNLTGAAVERTWNNIHAAECVLLELAPAAHMESLQAEALFRARQRLAKDDPRLVALEALTKGAVCAPAPGPGQGKPPRLGYRLWRWSHRRDARYVAARALRAAHTVEDAEKMRARSFRNILYASTVMLAAVAAGLALFGVVAPGALDLCFAASSAPHCPSGGRHPGRLDLPVVEVFGLSAAALTAAVALRNLDGTATPYSIPLALTLLKLPAGALSAVVGVSLISAGIVPGLDRLATPTQILAWAALFGAGQQALTRFVDTKGQQVLTNARPTSVPDGHESPDAVRD